MMKILQFSIMMVVGMLLFNGVLAQAPFVTNLSPQDNSTGVSLQGTLEIVFDIPVQKGEGSIEIRQTTDDSLVEIIDVNSSLITVSQTAESVVINPANSFDFSTGYYVQVSSGAFSSLGDEPFAGIHSKSFWNFSTGCSSAPETLPPGFISSSFVVLQWEGIPDISEYQIWVSGKGTFNVTDGSNELLITELVPGTTYSWNIKSVCRGVGFTNFSGLSNTTDFTTSGTNPCNASPTIQATTNITNSSVRLNWSSKTGVSDYQVWISGIGTIYTTNGLNYLELTGLTPGSSYSYSLKAKCSASGSTTFSPSVTGQFSTTGSNPCDSNVTGLNATADDNSALLEWTAIDGVSDYQLWISGIGTIYSTGGQNSFLLDDLAPGFTYTWSIKSKCQSTGRTIFSGSSSGQFTTLGESNCAQAPNNLVANNIEQNSVNLSWSDMGVSDYQIWVSGIGTIFSTGGQNSYTIEGLASGSTYTWKVKSKCEFNGRTTFSGNSSGEFTTSGESNCAQAPQNLNVINIGTSDVILEWDDMGASDYQLSIVGIGTIYSTNGQNSYPLENLAAGTTYTWRVKAKCQRTGRTTFSSYSTGEFTTPEPLNVEIDDQEMVFSDSRFEKNTLAVQEEILKVSLFPNPSVDNVTLAVDGDNKITSIVVVDSNGNTVMEIDNLNSTSEILGLRTYGSGIYFIIVIVNNNQKITEKAIIQ